MNNVCEHGSLKRSCQICELVEAIRERDAVLRQALGALNRYTLWETSDDTERFGAEAIAAIKAILNP